MIRGNDEWLDLAACLDADPEIFFVTDRTLPSWERKAREADAKAFCARCSVRRECLEAALARREPIGVWGGLNELEREQLLQREAA